nr:MAG TPA: hypothetical protein [Caudoviricetes sp.]
MSVFNGFLLKNSSGETIDNYIQFDTYNSTPNQREEIDAYRDDNTRELYRATADGMKTAISFSTKDLDLNKKMAIQQFFTNATVIGKERKVYLTYWNDEDNVYKSSYFYIPDIKFTIKRIESDNIFYEPLDIELIEY